MIHPGRDRHTQVPERVEGDGRVTAHRAQQRRLQLANKKFNEYGVIVTQEALPCLHRLLDVTEAVFDVSRGSLRSAGDTIDVLLQSFQQMQEEFLCVLLLVPPEERRVPLVFQLEWCCVESLLRFARVFPSHSSEC